MTARLFELVRHTDVSGVSGTGVVAEGIEYADGGIALRWKGEWPATAVWPNMEALLAIHGHDGKTTARYLDGQRVIRTTGTVDTIVQEILSGRAFTGLMRHLTDGRLEIHAGSASEWRDWLRILGGSEDAATVEPRPGSKAYPWAWAWVAPDNSIRVYFITADRDEIKPEAG